DEVESEVPNVTDAITSFIASTSTGEASGPVRTRTTSACVPSVAYQASKVCPSAFAAPWFTSSPESGVDGSDPLVELSAVGAIVTATPSRGNPSPGTWGRFCGPTTGAGTSVFEITDPGVLFPDHCTVNELVVQPGGTAAVQPPASSV